MLKTWIKYLIPCGSTKETQTQVQPHQYDATYISIEVHLSTPLSGTAGKPTSSNCLS